MDIDQKPFLGAAGAQYGSFTVTKCIPLVELCALFRELVHEPTGAQIMHIENDDPENLFCLSFQTLPSSSNGAPHILEHTVLCGSQKFPIKDPFFSMDKRSLHTYMNALTGADFTCYPAASQVEKDFYNLLEVYLDAVFHPELKELSFLQEGCRLEFVDPKDPTSSLQYKGVVINEMKGALLTGESRLWHALLALLTPDLPYAYNSGGDPKDIPSLTYAQLRTFHSTFYQPSRCLFFFYGNLPLQKHLDFIEERTLKNSVKLPSLPPLPQQKRFSQTLTQKIRYPTNETDHLERKAFLVFGWLTASILEQEEVLALSVLDAILMQTDASPLKRRLLQSELCIQADGYMDTEMSEIPYAIVCKGCKAEDVESLEAVLKEALQAIVKEGISKERIDSAIHQLELAYTEISGDHAPFGLVLFMRSALAKQHGCNPEYALSLHTLFQHLLLRVKDPTFFPSLIEKYFLNNAHFVRLVMTPDPHLAEEEASQERELLKTLQKTLSSQEKQKILEQTSLLERYQKETESQSTECLPKITLPDVPRFVRSFPLNRETHENLTTFHHTCFTNHFLYADLLFELPELSEEELSYLPLFTTLLSEVGCGKRDYAANLEYIQAMTGGIGASVSLQGTIFEPSHLKPLLSIRGKALERNGQKLLSLFTEIATSVRFDETKRIEDLIQKIATSLQNRFNKHALNYAIHLAQSGFSQEAYIKNLWHGLPYFTLIEQLSKNLSQKLPHVIEMLHTLKRKILCASPPQLVLCCDAPLYATLSKEQFSGLKTLELKPFSPWKDHTEFPRAPSAAIAKPIASPVAFNVEAFSLKSMTYLHPFAPALSCAAALFENLVLHRTIREQGGAYNSGCTFLSMSSSLYFHSYRDPSIASTLRAFHQAIHTVSKGEFSKKDLEEAKLGVIQQMDSPVPPSTRALTAYYWDRTGKAPEVRQHYRDALLALKTQDVQRAVKETLLQEQSKGSVVSFASKELIAAEFPQQ